MSAFVIADTHWGHAKSLSFIQPDGSPLRPFDSVEEMDETMVERWNATVGKKDTIYHLRRCNHSSQKSFLFLKGSMAGRFSLKAIMTSM
jgi:calcineurin-like phosphoesterase family protein